MANAFSLSLLSIALVQLLLLSPANAFHSTHVPTSLTRNLILDQSTSGHRSRQSTGLTHENSFSRSPVLSGSSLYSFQIRSIFRSAETSEATLTTTTTTATTTDAPTSSRTYDSKGNYIKVASLEATSKAARTLKNASQSLVNGPWSERADQLLQFVLQYWWSIPTFLALVPLYTTFVLGTGDAAMPHWWPVTPMDHIVKAPDAAMVLSVFLGSNIAFFLAGGYLLKKFPFVRPEVTTLASTVEGSSSLLLSLKNHLLALRYIPTRQSWLGLLMLGSGLISTIFHVEQALGSYAMANSLCYLDHAVAGTSTFYYCHTCGKPSKKVIALAVAGAAALSIVPPHPLPGYAWLHSAWHFLAAAAAVLWAVESFDQPSTSIVQPISLDLKDS